MIATAKSLRPVLLFCGLTILSPTFASESKPNPVTWANSYVIDAPPSGVELGMGWNRFSESIIPNRCIQFAPIQEGGQTTSLTLSEVSDSAELSQHLGVSASASIKGLGYSASGSASFVADSSVKSSSTSFAVRASVTNGAMFVGPYQPTGPRRFSLGATQNSGAGIPVNAPETAVAVGLSPWVLKKFDDDGFDEETFRRYCGTGFVSAVYSGVEMFQVITITTSEKSTKSQIKAAVQGSYGIGAASASAEKDDEALFTKANTEMSFFQRGGANGIIPASREEVLDKLKTLTREASDAPKFYDIRITPYSDLPNYPGNLAPSRQFHKEIIVRRYLQLKTFDRDLQSVIDTMRTPGNDTASNANNDQPVPDPITYDSCFAIEYYEGLQDNIRTLIKLIEKAQQKTADDGWNYTSFKAPETAIEQLGLSLPSDKSIAPLIFDPDPAIENNWFLRWLAYDLNIARLKALLPPLVSGGQKLCTIPSDDNKRKLYREAVLNQYIRPANDRLCSGNYGDPDCLSNAEIRQISQYIPFVASMQQFNLNPAAQQQGYLCSAHPTALRRCIARTEKSGDDVFMTNDLSKAELFSVKAQDQAVMFTQTPKGGDDSPPLVLSLGGKGPVLSYGIPSLKIIATTEGDEANLLFTPSIRRRDESTPYFYRLAPKIKNKRGEYCLLDKNRDTHKDIGGRVLVWPRPGECNTNDPNGYTRDAYTWIFFSKELYTPPDEG